MQSVVSETTLAVVREQLKQLEQQADALRSGLDEMGVLLTWAAERSIPPSALQKVAVTDEEIADNRHWNGELLPDELVRLFLQAHTLATRLKYLVPPDQKQTVISAVVETFLKMAEAQHLQVPVEMEVTIGD